MKAAIQALIRHQDFADRLAALATTYGDGLPLPAPATDAIFTSEKATLPSRPAVEIIGDANIRRTADDSAEAYDRRIAIVWTVLADDEEQGTAQLERYLEATRGLLFNQILPQVDDVAPTIVGNEDFGPIGRRNESSPLEKVGVIEVIVPTFA